MFETTMQKGFHITFTNGLTASVQWGVGNYCDNRFPQEPGRSIFDHATSTTAEVAVIDKNNNLLDDIGAFLPDNVSHTDSVAGYLTPEEVAYFLKKVSEKA